MEEQIALSFDKKTRAKILKSLWIAVIAPAVVYGLQQLGTIHFHVEDPQVDYFLIWFLPVLINGAIEFVKGKSR